MAEGDAIVHNNFKEQLMLKTIDCVGDTFNVALYDTAVASPDGAAPAYTVTNEIVASGYVAGGKPVLVPVVAQDDGNDWANWDDDGSNITWTSLATATILEATLYDDTTGTKWILIFWEIATNSNGGDYTIQFGANGIATIS